MIEAPQIVECPAKAAAIIRLTIPRAEIRNIMSPAMKELMATVASQALVVKGPMFSHHLRIAPDVFDFELGVPVEGTIVHAGRVTAGQLPAATVARTVFHGDYMGLGAAWEEFDKWIVSSGHIPAPNMLECYLVGRESSANPATWRTELNRPVG